MRAHAVEAYVYAASSPVARQGGGETKDGPTVATEG
jgi:hypothetical protein